MSTCLPRGRGAEGLDGGKVGDVQSDEVGVRAVGADRFGGLLTLVLGDIAQHHVCASGGKRFGRCSADAGCRPGDDRCLSVDSHREFLRES
jgi:hypothetical protein